MATLQHLFLALSLSVFALASNVTFFEDDLGSEGVSINNQGWVIGFAAVQPIKGIIEQTPVVWNSKTNQKLSVPNVPGYTFNHLKSISPNKLEVAGIAARPKVPNDVAFFWSPETGTIPLGFLEDHNFSAALGITDNRVVGFSGGNDHQYQPCLWEKQGTNWKAIALPHLSPAYSIASAISPNGQYIVGHEGGHLMVWKNTGADWERIEIAPEEYAYPAAVNDQGEIVGKTHQTVNGNSQFVAFYSNLVDKKIVRLGYTQTNHGNSQAYAINSQGLVVGMSGTTTLTEFEGFVWSKKSGLKAYSFNGQPLTQIKSINDLGTILGEVPQPSSEPLLDYSAVKMFVAQKAN